MFSLGVRKFSRSPANYEEARELEESGKRRREHSAALTKYRGRNFGASRQEQEAAIARSATLYVGNLSYYTTEEQMHELFFLCGDLKRIVLGLDLFKKTPCCFAFVEWYERSAAEAAMPWVNGTGAGRDAAGRPGLIRCDWDAGFVEGRQFGRGRTGGQGGGGWGKIITQRSAAPIVLPTYSKDDPDPLHSATGIRACRPNHLQ